MLAPYVWPCRFPLNFATLQQAATHVLGTHDFTSFAANDPDLTTRNATTQSIEDEDTGITSSLQTNQRDAISILNAVQRTSARAAAVEKPASLPQLSTGPIDNTRTIFHSDWRQQESLFIYRVTGSGFLHHMVRNLVGTFVEAATNRISVDTIPAILAARNRSAAGPTAPASGLFLVEVEY